MIPLNPAVQTRTKIHFCEFPSMYMESHGGEIHLQCLNIIRTQKKNLVLITKTRLTDRQSSVFYPSFIISKFLAWKVTYCPIFFSQKRRGKNHQCIKDSTDPKSSQVWPTIHFRFVGYRGLTIRCCCFQMWVNKMQRQTSAMNFRKPNASSGHKKTVSKWF